MRPSTLFGETRQAFSWAENVNRAVRFGSCISYAVVEAGASLAASDVLAMNNAPRTQVSCRGCSSCGGVRCSSCSCC